MVSCNGLNPCSCLFEGKDFLITSYTQPKLQRKTRLAFRPGTPKPRRLRCGLSTQCKLILGVHISFSLQFRNYEMQSKKHTRILATLLRFLDKVQTSRYEAIDLTMTYHNILTNLRQELDLFYDSDWHNAEDVSVWRKKVCFDFLQS